MLPRLIAAPVAILSLIACAKSAPRTEQGFVPHQNSSSGRASVTAQERGLALLPEINKLPVSTNVFCAGLQKVLPTMKQDLSKEAKVLCNGATATPLLNDLVSAPYAGVGVPELRTIPSSQNVGQGNIQNYVAFAIRIPKKPVPAILAEEQLVNLTKYQNADGFSIALKIDPELPINEGDCDTAFRVIQNAKSTNERAVFDDVSKHDLKLYRLHPDNFDYLAAGRTLITATEQIKYATILRGFMPDPADNNYTISFSVVNSVMNGRGFNDRVGASFSGFISSDVGSSYDFHAGR